MQKIKADWVEATFATAEDTGYPDEQDMLFIDVKGHHITIFEDGDISIEKSTKEVKKCRQKKK